jgi:hypothetical protein
MNFKTRKKCFFYLHPFFSLDVMSKTMLEIKTLD